MRKNFGAKPYTYPQPVFMIATYDENGTPDVMNAAWGGISEGNELSMCISEGHKEPFSPQSLYCKHGRCSSYGSLRLCGYRFRKQRTK